MWHVHYIMLHLKVNLILCMHTSFHLDLPMMTCSSSRPLMKNKRVMQPTSFVLSQVCISRRGRQPPSLSLWTNISAEGRAQCLFVSCRIQFHWSSLCLYLLKRLCIMKSVKKREGRGVGVGQNSFEMWIKACGRLPGEVAVNPYDLRPTRESSRKDHWGTGEAVTRGQRRKLSAL